jgi:uncharacterized CHY-type Zn-finger protein
MNTNKRKRFKKKAAPEEWVACISCGHEYYIEKYEGRPECPVCESREYEPATSYPLLTIRDDYYENF